VNKSSIKIVELAEEIRQCVHVYGELTKPHMENLYRLLDSMDKQLVLKYFGRENKKNPTEEKPKGENHERIL
jgi:hypothetical protein